MSKSLPLEPNPLAEEPNISSSAPRYVYMQTHTNKKEVVPVPEGKHKTLSTTQCTVVLV
jgi:hypothetical protein